ncbi:uncharacterized protein LOC119083556 [Bradysia coprophila]|uniref:uncharacterized protein LOC119083556 n=1 Tax=Bradysia coprophila TaxID=38358 RepID=UPI00187DA634|nr:uncharacterized protein LOC119083556 [Bradysia coprophila]
MNEKTMRCAAVAFAFLSVTAQASALTCTERGLFPDPDSDDCKSFFSCNTNLDVASHQCTGDTYFSPELKGCFSTYDCATRTIPYITNPCEDFDYDRIPDKYSLDCSEYFYCQTSSVYNNGESLVLPQAVTEVCYAGASFNPQRGCNSNNKCSTYECSVEGEFEDANGNDCTTFVRCSKYNTRLGYGGSLLFPEIVTCPESTKFNPFLQKCDSFYNCDGIDPHGGIDPCGTYNLLNPLIPNPYVSDAASYISCEYYDNNYEKRQIILRNDCPVDTFFSPNLGRCYNNYDPNETCSKDACSNGPGKYFNYKSDECDSYIECRDEAQQVGIYELTYEIRYCPEGTRFNPDTRSCSKKYICPAPVENYCYEQLTTTTPDPATLTTAAP